MNEEVMISLKANVQPFKSAMKNVTKDISLAYKDMEEFSAIIDNANGKQLKDITSNLQKGIKETNTLIEDMQKELVIATQTNAPVAFIDRLKNDIGVAKGEVVDMKKKLSLLGKDPDGGKLSGFFDIIKDKTKDLGQSLKHTGKLLLTAFTFAAFGTFRKGFQEAISLSDTAGAKFQAISNTIASSLVPVLDAVAGAVQKAFVWVAGFIKALTGFDMIQKGIDGTNKKINKLKSSIKGSAKETKGMLSGLDEIQNIDTNTDTGGSGGGISDDMASNLASLGELEDMMAQMNAMDFSWVEPIKGFFQWVIDNWQLVVVGITGIILILGALKLASFLATVGLTGLLVPFLAIALAVTGLIALVMGICELFKEGGDQSKAWTLILGGLLLIVVAIGLAFGAIPMAIAALVAAVVAGVLWVIKNFEQVKTFFSNVCKAIGDFFKGLWDKIVSIFKGIGKWFGDRVSDIISFFKSIPSKVGGFFSQLWDKITSTFKNIGQAVGDAITGALKKAVNAVLKTAVNIINGFIKGINFAIGIINAIPGVNISKITLLDVPSFDVGTSNVPYDMLAQVHKGEAIIPERFNDDKFFGDGEVDLSETNSLIEELIQVLLNKKFGITETEVGKASLNYIRTMSRLKGEPVV